MAVTKESWDNLQVGTKLRILAGAALIEFYLVAEDTDFIELIIKGATYEEGMEYLNENY